MSDELDPEINNELRDGVLVVVKQVPEIGAILSFMVGLLWAAEDDPEKVWREIKVFAEKMVKDALDKQVFEQMTDKLKAHKNAVTFYTNQPYGNDYKWNLLGSLITTLTAGAGDFNNRSNLKQTFTLFTSYSTLLMAAYAEYAFNSEKVSGQPDTDEAKRHGRVAEFYTRLAEQTTAAQEMFDQLYEARFAQLSLTEWQDRHGPTKLTSTWTFKDAFDNFSESRSGEDWVSNTGFHAPIPRRILQGMFDFRTAQIKANYVEALQDLVAVASLWRYLDPHVPRPESFRLVSANGNFGGDLGRVGAAPFNVSVPDTDTLLGVRVHYGTYVDGVELIYQQAGTVKLGACGGGTMDSLMLDAGERIVEVSGRSGEVIDQLVLLTSHGRQIVTGRSGGGSPFRSRGRKEWKETALFGFDGRMGPTRIVSLIPLWGHQVSCAPYVPGYKRNGKPLTRGARFTLRSEDGRYVSGYTQEGIKEEYYPHIGSAAVTLSFGDAKDGAEQLHQGAKVPLVTTEREVKTYNHLARYADQLYYYEPSGKLVDLWGLEKLIPSDGPVMFGEKVYLRNAEEQSFLYPREDKYLGARNEPYAWTFEAV